MDSADTTATKTGDALDNKNLRSDLSSPNAHDARQRSLRTATTDDADDVDKEERVGGTELVAWAHKLSKEDAKIVRQISKGNSPEHILTKLRVPYKMENGYKVYSIHDPDYQKYLKWVKRLRDDPLTFDAKAGPRPALP
ncbi:unnamed protein product [Phytophthora lilii]|uniref:Unnamed protein product n=1 Tax=Phytophthora lilii TaxID=2077276 RepID=A0A9W6TRQ5_9STRA|nr:unnamed protein product [Phytophthora lilii]